MPNFMHMAWSKNYRGTPAELALEAAVASLGVPYRTQFPCFLYAGGVKAFPDFLLPTLGIVIEVDDPSHETKKEADLERANLLLEKFGWKTYRVTNAEALRDPHVALNRVMDAAGIRRSLADGHPTDKQYQTWNHPGLSLPAVRVRPKRTQRRRSARPASAPVRAAGGARQDLLPLSRLGCLRATATDLRRLTAGFQPAAH